MRRVGEKLVADRKPLFPTYKLDKKTIYDNSKGTYVQKIIKPIIHMQMPVRTDLGRGSTNTLILTTHPGGLKPLSLEIHPIVEYNKKKPVNVQYIIGHQLSINSYNNSLSIDPIYNNNVDLPYYCGCMRNVLDESENNVSIPYMIIDDFPSDGKPYSKSDRLEYLKEFWVRGKKNSTLSKDSFIFERGDEYLIINPVPLSQFIDFIALSKHYQYLKMSYDSHLIIDSQYNSGLISEETYVHSKQLFVLALESSKSSIESDGIVLELDPDDSGYSNF